MLIHSARMIGKSLRQPRENVGWRGWMMIGWLVIGACALGAPRQLLWIAGVCFAFAMFEKSEASCLSWLRFRWIVGLPFILLKSALSIAVFAFRRPRQIHAIVVHYRLNLDHRLSREETEARAALSPQAALNLWRKEGKTGRRMEAARIGSLIEAFSRPEPQDEKEKRMRRESREAAAKKRSEEIAALVATVPADSPVWPRRVRFRLATGFV
jgi:hypothetical protein